MCDGSNHGKFAAPCREFACDHCGGAMCQKTSRAVQFAVGSSSFVCEACASLYTVRRTAQDGAVAWWAGTQHGEQ